MSLRKFNECFKNYYQSTVLNENLNEDSNNDLRKDLLDTVDNLINNGVTNIKQYEDALQQVIENHYPDNSWWDVCSLNIFWHLFTERNPMSTVDAIMDNLTVNSLDSYSSPMELEEAANPENEEVNKLIRDIVNGDSRAYGKLRKLGYEVEIDDSARKEFGKDHFGKRIQIVNKETGRMIYADPGHSWKSDDSIIARPVDYNADKRKSNLHRVKGGKGFKQTNVDPKAFDYKGYLDKPLIPIDDTPTTVQQFKQDKRFIKDNEYTLKRGKEAEDRLAAIRSRFKKGGLNESMDVDNLLPLLIKEYDEYCDPSVDLESDLISFTEYLTMYSQDCEKWFAKDCRTMFELGIQYCDSDDAGTSSFERFVRGALSELVFGYIGKFEAIYNEHKSR